jgi:hypothetical protein
LFQKVSNKKNEKRISKILPLSGKMKKESPAMFLNQKMKKGSPTLSLKIKI